MSTIAERVQAGCECLDEHVPGWETQIDLEDLALSSCFRCVVGQLAGSSAEDGLAAITGEVDDAGRWPPSLGFSVPARSGGPTVRQWNTLTAAWRRAIRARLAEQPASKDDER